MPHLFTYGTLMFEEIFSRVIATPEPQASQSARLVGYQRFKVIGEVYPALIPSDQATSVAGRIYFDLTTDQMLRLDAFEGEMYERTPVAVVTEGQGLSISCETYVCHIEYRNLVSNQIWSPFNFGEQAQRHFIERFSGWRA